MPTSTRPDASAPTHEPDLFADEDESAAGFLPSRAGIVLSAQARERLKLLNQVLANCVPKSIEQHESAGSETN